MTPIKKRLIGTLGATIILAISVSLVFGQSNHSSRPTGGPAGDPPSQSAGKPAVKMSEEPANPAVDAPSKPKLAPDASRKKTPEATLPTVGVVKVTAQSHQASVNGYGEVSSRFMLSLTAQASGEVTQLAEHFETGAIFKKGEVIAYINDTDYQQALTAAKVAVEGAKVALEEERLQGIQALEEWQRSGLQGEPDSTLVLRKPYLESAQATLNDAIAQFDIAKRDLTLTQIVAPFDAIIVSREIQPGSFIQEGTAVATLYSINEAEISVPLSASQWRTLPEVLPSEEDQWQVEITDMDGLYHWQGNVKRVEQHLDTASRQRAAIVQVSAPLEQPVPLYFGTYVKATIAGRTLDNVWEIPSSAISQKLEVWFVNAQNELANFAPEILFQAHNSAYIAALPNMPDITIVTRPLNSYLPGTKVNAQQEGVQQ